MGKKILLVEDDAFVRDLYQTVLTRANYELDIANDGEEAVNLASYKTYDLILLDIMLPKLTGMEVLKTLRNETSRAKDTPVYLLTNLGEENIVKESYKLGANGYLLKAKYLPKQLVEEVDKFFVKSPLGPGGVPSTEGELPNVEVPIVDDGSVETPVEMPEEPTVEAPTTTEPTA